MAQQRIALLYHIVLSDDAGSIDASVTQRVDRMLRVIIGGGQIGVNGDPVRYLAS